MDREDGMSRRHDVTPGECFEAKEKGRGLYLALSMARSNQFCNCLVLIEDKMAPHEPPGSEVKVNCDWLLGQCWRVG